MLKQPAPQPGGAPTVADGVLCHDNLLGYCPRASRCPYSHHVDAIRYSSLPCSEAPHCQDHRRPPPTAASPPPPPPPPPLRAAAAAPPPPEADGGAAAAAADDQDAAGSPPPPWRELGGAAPALQWRWEWEQSAPGGRKVWAPYDGEAAAHLEAQYLTGRRSWEAEVRGKQYHYDFLRMVQINRQTSTERRMRRLAPAPAEAEQVECWKRGEMAAEEHDTFETISLLHATDRPPSTPGGLRDSAAPPVRWVTQQGDGHADVAFYARIGGRVDWHIPNGEEVEVTGSDGDFAAIVYKEQSGFVKRRNLQPRGAAAPPGPAPALGLVCDAEEQKRGERAREEQEQRGAAQAQEAQEQRRAARAQEDRQGREVERARAEREGREREERERREREELERRVAEAVEGRMRQWAEVGERERQRRQQLHCSEADARAVLQRDERSERLGPAELQELARILGRGEPLCSFELEAAVRAAGSRQIDAVAGVLLQWGDEVDDVRKELCSAPEFADLSAWALLPRTRCTVRGAMRGAVRGAVPLGEVDAAVRPVALQQLGSSGGGRSGSLIDRCREALRAHQQQLHGEAEPAERTELGLSSFLAEPCPLPRDVVCASGKQWRRLDRQISGGAGCFGKVYPASLVTARSVSPPDYCLKLINEEAVCDQTGWDRHHCRQRFEREVALLRRAQHPNVVALHDDGVINGRFAVMVMEYLKGGTLDEVFTASFPGRPVPSRIARRLFAQLAVALRHLDDLRIVHRDLKPKNIVLSQRISPGATQCDGVVLKLIDFGIAAELEMGSIQDTRLPPAVGALGWMAPETVAGSHRDGRTDVWASGCILFQFAVGAVPFDMSPGTTQYRLQQRICRGERLKQMPAVPEGEDPRDWALQWELVDQLLQVPIDCRPAAGAVCSHPWVRAAVLALGGSGAGPASLR
eukprot:TRINITY_DN17477_c0_g2_i3.p1 TRINITY_DN17477_c0_g2~~TRINITY_DN17477_c0_g2_i3.p1  ORF type:complete len:956 (+),score=284.01 TRINITY_DN17477_c0_g2_i3:101-2869(+)